MYEWCCVSRLEIMDGLGGQNLHEDQHDKSRAHRAMRFPMFDIVFENTTYIKGFVTFGVSYYTLYRHLLCDSRGVGLEWRLSRHHLHV